MIRKVYWGEKSQVQLGKRPKLLYEVAKSCKAKWLFKKMGDNARTLTPKSLK